MRLLAELALVAFHGQLGRAVDDGGVVAGEFVLVEQLAHFHLDELEQLGVVDHVALVQEHDDVGHADLAGQQDVLAGLRHRAVGGRAHQDRAVHLGGAGDHVLDVVGVARGSRRARSGGCSVSYSTWAVLMVMPRAFSSGAASIWSYALASPPNLVASTVVIAAVSVVLPWST